MAKNKHIAHAVTLNGLTGAKCYAQSDGSLSVEFGIGPIRNETDDGLASDMLYGLCRYYGVERHQHLIEDLLCAPARLDRMAAEASAKKIAAE